MTEEIRQLKFAPPPGATTMKITDVRIDRLKVRGTLVRVYTDEGLVGLGLLLLGGLVELAPGATQILQVTVRLRPNLAADAVITPRHTLTYQDSNANAYRGQ